MKRLILVLTCLGCLTAQAQWYPPPPSGGGGGGATIDSTTNLIKGDNAGNGVDSTIVPANVPLLDASNLFTGSNTITVSGTGIMRPLIARNSSAANGAYTVLAIRNDLNSTTRSLNLGYVSSTTTSQIIGAGPAGEIGFLVNTGAFPLVFGTSNAARMTLFDNGGVTIDSSSGTSPGAFDLRVSGGNIYGGATTTGGFNAGLTLDANGANNDVILKPGSSGNIFFQSASRVINIGNGQTSSFPGLKASSASLQARLGDDSNFTSFQSLYDRFGSGTPESAVTAPVGAVYHRTDGGAVTSFYVKESGAGTTGWVAK